MVDTQRRPRAVRAAGGEIVEVQGGGHIVRATGRKDRHSKVCTAKGLRDRRVRLSAHTAIQFYDVQDRLGLDRPSKAVDWLIKNAKPSIDQLAQLPPWRPPDPSPAHAPAGDHDGQKSHVSTDTGDYGASAYGYCGSSSLLPPSLDSDSIADTIKSFFPRTATAAAAASPSYPSALDLLSHGGGGSRSHAEDLRLSLQSFQDPIFSHQQSRATPAHQALYSAPMTFDAAGSSWPEPGHRAATWNLAEPSSGEAGGSGGRYLFGLSSQLVQNQFFTQWGTLQSSNPPLIRALADPIALSSAAGHQMHLAAFRPSSASQVPVYQNASGDLVGFSGYHMPARIHGGEEHDGAAVGDAPPAASSASHR